MNGEQPTSEQLFVAERCGAYLDGELNTAERVRFDAQCAASPECARFVEHQRALNTALRSTLGNGLPAGMPTEFRSRLLGTLRAEAENRDAAPSAGTQAPHAPAWRTRLHAWNRLFPVAAAALVVLTLVLAGAFAMERSRPRTLVPTAQPGLTAKDYKTTPTGLTTKDYETTLTGLHAVYTRLVAAGGSRDRREVEKYAHDIGFQMPVPKYSGMVQGHDIVPINVERGEIDGRSYHAVLFCSGNVVPEANAFSMRVCRFVLFFVDGNISPPEAPRDKQGVWVEKYVGCTNVAWTKQDEGDAHPFTCLLFTCSGTPSEQAFDIARPLLVAR